MTKVILNPVTKSDADCLAELRVRAMKESLEAVGRFDPIRAKNRFLENFDPLFTREILVNTERVGFIVVKEVEDYLYLDHLYIDPQHQSKGIGAAVLQQVFHDADIRSKAIKLGALKESRSNDFYRRHGFIYIESSDWDNHYIRLPRQKEPSTSLKSPNFIQNSGNENDNGLNQNRS
jgi:ribosomal protein S18 acetylase RimI-like enzyme